MHGAIAVCKSCGNTRLIRPIGSNGEHLCQECHLMAFDARSRRLVSILRAFATGSPGAPSHLDALLAADP